MADKVFALLKKIPDATTDEAHEVANKINRGYDLATKTDLAKLETRMTWMMIIWGLAIVGLIRYFGGA